MTAPSLGKCSATAIKCRREPVLAAHFCWSWKAPEGLALFSCVRQLSLSLRSTCSWRKHRCLLQDRLLLFLLALLLLLLLFYNTLLTCLTLNEPGHDSCRVPRHESWSLNEGRTRRRRRGDARRGGGGAAAPGPPRVAGISNASPANRPVVSQNAPRHSFAKDKRRAAILVPHGKIYI